jgi:hypothetical protein
MIWQVNISDKNEVLNERCIIFFKKMQATVQQARKIDVESTRPTNENQAHLKMEGKSLVYWIGVAWLWLYC